MMDSNIFADCGVWTTTGKPTAFLPPLLCYVYAFTILKRRPFCFLLLHCFRIVQHSNKFQNETNPRQHWTKQLQKVRISSYCFTIVLRQDMKWSRLLSLCYYCSKGFPGTASSNSAMSVHYGNMGCGVFKRGVQNQKGFCIRINILKGNY